MSDRTMKSTEMYQLRFKQRTYWQNEEGPYFIRHLGLFASEREALLFWEGYRDTFGVKQRPDVIPIMVLTDEEEIGAITKHGPNDF